MKIIVAALALSLTATAALAQAAAPAEPTPQKLALAHELIEASGGAQQVTGVMRTMFQGINTTLSKSLPPEQARIGILVQAQIQDGVIALAPQFIAISEQVYARDFTEPELRDEIVWLRSESGRAIKAKTQTVLHDTITAEVPIIAAAMPAILQKSMDTACQQVGCSAKDRQVIAAAVAKAMQPHAS